jgi:5-methylcytosine-specific restriction endonuclease McrA
MIKIKTNRKRTWSENQLREAVKNSTSIRQVLNKLKLREAGGNYSQIKKYIEFYKIETEHLKGKGWSKGLKGIGKPRIELKDILVRGNYFQSYKLKKRLFEADLKRKQCEECGWHKISEDGRLPLELDHINGDSRDNRLENLRVLCPNCHSLKPTHRGRNRKIKK